jgi:hypothetical protein
VSLFTSIKNAGNDIKKVVDIKRNSVGGIILTLISKIIKIEGDIGLTRSLCLSISVKNKMAAMGRRNLKLPWVGVLPPPLHEGQRH